MKTLYQIVDENNDAATVGYEGNLFGTEEEAKKVVDELGVSQGWDVSSLRVIPVAADDVADHPMFEQYA